MSSVWARRFIRASEIAGKIAGAVLTHWIFSVVANLVASI